MAGIWNVNGGVYVGFPANSTEGKPPPLRDPLRYTGDRHICTIAPNRTGKTKRLLLPALFDLTGWSILVNDIRGDLCKMTEAHRRAAGSEIIKLNPFDILKMGSDGFDPVQALDPTSDEFSDDALELAEAVIRVESKEAHWPHAGQEITAAVIMYTKLVIPGGSFADVRALLSQDHHGIRRLIRGGRNTDPRQYEMFQEDPESAPKDYAPPFRYEGKLYPGILAAAYLHKWPEMGFKAARFSDINPENRELLSVLSTVNTQMRWLDSRRVKADLAKNPFDFSVMKIRPVTVYLILPARRLGTHSSWLRLIITSIVQKLMQDGTKSKVPILFGFDEYAAVAGSTSYGADASSDGFPVIARNMPMLAGYFVKLWTIFQDIPQAERIYGQAFSSFLGNAGIAQFFAPQDVPTAKYISERSGQSTREILTRGESLSPNPGMPGGMQRSHSANLGYIPMPLMLPEDARNMDEGFSVIFTHKEKGVVRSYLPYPTELPHLRAVCALDPSN